MGKVWDIMGLGAGTKVWDEMAHVCPALADLVELVELPASKISASLWGLSLPPAGEGKRKGPNPERLGPSWLLRLGFLEGGQIERWHRQLSLSLVPALGGFISQLAVVRLKRFPRIRCLGELSRRDILLGGDIQKRAERRLSIFAE